MESTIQCNHYNTVRDHVWGELPPETAEHFEEHLLLCDECRSAVAHLETAVMHLSSFLSINLPAKSQDTPGCIPQVLIVEDNLADIALIKATLRAHSANTNVCVAEDGDEAIRLLASMAYAGLEPDLILLDLNLPNRNGHEVLAYLRGNAKLKTTPVAIFTSSDRPADVKKAYSMGADCYVLKGNDLDSFTRNVAAICSFWSSAGAALPVLAAQ